MKKNRRKVEGEGVDRKEKRKIHAFYMNDIIENNKILDHGVGKLQFVNPQKSSCDKFIKKGLENKLISRQEIKKSRSPHYLSNEDYVISSIAKVMTIKNKKILTNVRKIRMTCKTSSSNPVVKLYPPDKSDVVNRCLGCKAIHIGDSISQLCDECKNKMRLFEEPLFYMFQTIGPRIILLQIFEFLLLKNNVSEDAVRGETLRIIKYIYKGSKLAKNINMTPIKLKSPIERFIRKFLSFQQKEKKLTKGGKKVKRK